MCQLAVPGAVSFPEAAARDDTDGSGLMAGRRVRGLRSSCSASHKAALMPMIPQRGAEEPFDDTLEAIDAAIDAELEEQHHALPLRHKKKVGRPLKYQGDPNSPHLTAEERRRLKRRQANRESARRVRQKRVETFGQLQAVSLVTSMAAYSASKAALASFADAVRPELALSGIHLAQVQPGVINSDFLERAQWRGEAAKEAQKQMEQMLQTSSFAQTPQQVADAVFNAVTKYKREVTVGLTYKATLTANWLGFNPASLLAKSE